MSTNTLGMCRCGDPLYPKAYEDGSDREYLACHHCDRLCGSWGVNAFGERTFYPDVKCKRCKRVNEPG